MFYFQYNGNTYSYVDHPSNQTRVNERRVELPIAFDFLKRMEGKRILEVGNVTHHYNRAYTHDVLDLYEKVPWLDIINEDILTWNPSEPYEAVLSISTLEHTADPLSAIDRVLSFAPNVLITVPYGYGDGWIERVPTYPGVDMFYMQRQDQENQWKQVSPHDVQGTRYNTPFPFANALLILEKGRV